MPGFIRTKKDEALWQKAKNKASKSKSKDESSFSDIDWALVNHIYHKMTKSINDKLSNVGSVDTYIEELLKIRRHLTGRDDPYSIDEPTYSNDDESGDSPEEQDYSVDPESIAEDYGIDDDGEDEASKWLSANDPQKAKSSEIKQPAPTLGEESPTKDPQRARSKFSEMTPERLAVLKPLAGHWLDYYDKMRMKEASAKNNPILHAEGHRSANSIVAHRDFDSELKKLQDSQEFKAMPRAAQFKALINFKKQFLANNPDFHQKALDKINEAQRVKETAINLANKEKQMKEAEIIHGGAAMMPPTGMSAEEAMQHVGGVKDEEGGYSTSVISDPKMGFAAGNRNFLNLAAQDKRARGLEVIDPKNIEDVSELDSHGLEIEQHPDLKHPLNKRHINEFLNEYMPLIQINANKVIKNKKAQGMPEDKLDEGDLNIAGMYGLMQAAHTYDKDAGASFTTHASNKISGAMNSKIGGQDFLPRQMRALVNFYNKHGKLPEPEFRQSARAAQFAHRKDMQSEQQSAASMAATTPSPTAPSTPSATKQEQPAPPKKTAHQMIESSSHPDAKAILDRKNRVDSVKRMIIRRGGENK